MKRRIKVELLLEIEDEAILCLDDSDMVKIVEESGGNDSYTIQYVENNFAQVLVNEPADVGALENIRAFSTSTEINVTIL